MVRLWNFEVCPSKSLKFTVGAPANSAVAIARLVQLFVGLSVQIPIVPRSRINVDDDVRHPHLRSQP